MQIVNPEVVNKPTPFEVLEAMRVIREYLKHGGWVQAIINANGGASFRLTDIIEEHWQFLKDAERDDEN